MWKWFSAKKLNYPKLAKCCVRVSKLIATRFLSCCTIVGRTPGIAPSSTYCYIQVRTISILFDCSSQHWRELPNDPTRVPSLDVLIIIKWSPARNSVGTRGNRRLSSLWFLEVESSRSYMWCGQTGGVSLPGGARADRVSCFLLYCTNANPNHSFCYYYIKQSHPSREANALLHRLTDIFTVVIIPGKDIGKHWKLIWLWTFIWLAFSCNSIDISHFRC